ncbi:Putative NADH-flavin reductase [Pseudovibrio denitrificans]|uniref:Putative NADH-flavin reductase n=1 Tax=Pseudovibrio denitrificans TaxID=258256 RepID=A0A1I7D066_9HYPH|nr:NAD(P)H-binding protein [Pseudovibrio denitrificans]SFU05100.1 Putative NADH-flavin reductase [Pseudovibrio denitrificans]
MKLGILGASGFVGRELCKAALAQGHDVRALVRSARSAEQVPEGVEVIFGDYFSAASLRELVDGVDAVLTTIGPPETRRSPLKPADFEKAMQQLVAAMQEASVSRVIHLASAGTRYGEEPLTLSRKLMRSILSVIVPVVIPSKEAELRVLAESGLNWTSIRPPLIAANVKGQLQTSETETQGFRVDVTQLCAFMLRAVHDERWFKTAPFVGTR